MQRDSPMPLGILTIPHQVTAINRAVQEERLENSTEGGQETESLAAYAIDTYLFKLAVHQEPGFDFPCACVCVFYLLCLQILMLSQAW